MTDTNTITKTRRQVLGVSATYFDVVPDLAGQLKEAVKTAQRGEFVDLVDTEAERLDGLGMLVPKGREIEGDPAQVRDQVNRAISQNASATIARALNPMDVAFPLPSIPPPSVSPPPGGVAPTGDITTGDTGIGDTPAPVVASGDSGLPIAPAEVPDAAVVDVGELSAYIEAERPNVEETVALAKGDATLAPKVLEAESVATGNDPRKGVVDALGKLGQ